MEAQQGLLLGIDIGGTKTRIALGRADGEILREARLENWTSGSFERDLEAVVDCARRLLVESDVPASAIDAVGVSAPGPLDPLRGVIRAAPNLPGWRDVPIRAHLSRALGRPVRLENDANAAALAEWRFGAGRGSRAFVFLTMSTGVGGGLVLDGALYRGARFGAGEIGHIPVVARGRKCVCGLRGCLEAYTGGRALALRIARDLRRGVRTAIRDLVDGDPARVDAKVWVEALRAKDAYAMRLHDEWLERLAMGLAIVAIGLDTDCIALGTIVASHPDLFLEPLRERFDARVWPDLRDTRLVVGELGERLPAYAGLCTALLEPISGSPGR